MRWKLMKNYAKGRFKQLTRFKTGAIIQLCSKYVKNKEDNYEKESGISSCNHHDGICSYERLWQQRIGSAGSSGRDQSSS